MSFTIHPQLDKDTILLGHISLCEVRLMNNALYPWIILVPAQADLKEITDLSTEHQITLIREISLVSTAMQHVCQPDKMNVAALGNMVPQLHIHIIARFKDDNAWPNPVWGTGGKPYSDQGLQETTAIIMRELAKLSGEKKAAGEEV